MRVRLLGMVLFLGVAACSASPSPTPPAPIPTRIPSTPNTLRPVADEVHVTDPESLRAALAAARPGQTITLADGLYSGRPPRGDDGSEPGRYLINVSGTADAPITLRGSRDAVIDGDGPGGGYVLHLVGADNWILRGFTASSGAKGIVLDRSGHNVLDGVRVTDIGAEGVHFRDSSSDNVLQSSDVDHTGVKQEGFGEGVYLGSANSNWGRYSGGRPDRSDRNQVLDNRITDTAAENIDVKGSDYLIAGNHGLHAATTIDPQDCARGRTARFCNGFEIHTPIEGSGVRNTFRGNRLEVNAPGAGIWLQNSAVDRGNVIGCDNEVLVAAAGPYATNHYSPLTCTP